MLAQNIMGAGLRGWKFWLLASTHAWMNPIGVIVSVCLKHQIDTKSMKSIQPYVRKSSVNFKV
jgi:hypothetical protein